jgi:MarR family 2-MHQ and catechol resistance regulon transcriptional repressor
MSRFEINADGRVHEVEVREIAQALRDRFPENHVDGAAIEANLMVARAYGALSAVVAGHWSEFGLTAHRYTTLRMLFLADQHRRSMKEIAAGLNVGITSVTKLVNGLEKDGLVRRVIDPRDRRVVYAQLTRDGLDRYLTVYPDTHRRLREAWSALDEGEKGALVHLLAKLRMHILSRSIAPHLLGKPVKTRKRAVRKATSLRSGS